MSDAIAFVATDADAGRRLDVVVAEHAHRSRNECAQAIKRGFVRVNGATAKSGRELARGDRVEVALREPHASTLEPETIALRIAYDDADLCVVDKPAGMATHPAPGSGGGTLVNALLAKFERLPAASSPLRPGIVHRLDKETSGLIVVAKSERAMSRLAAAMRARRIAREYDAVVWGVPAAARGVIDAPLGRDPDDRTRFAVREDGRRAVTHYAVAEEFPTCSLLSVSLDTGRTHQIRVHCAAIAHPVVGDAVYGPGRPRLGMARQALHAARLRFEHPIFGQPLSFESPWPDDFAALVRRLREERNR